MKNLLYEHKNLKIEEDTSFQGLLLTWNGFTNDEEFKVCIDKSLEYIGEYAATRLIHDMTNSQGISPKSQEYASTQSKKITEKLGQIKRALIMPKDVFAKFSVNNVNQRTIVEDGQIRRNFQSYEEARDWLLSEEDI